MAEDQGQFSREVELQPEPEREELAVKEVPEELGQEQVQQLQEQNSLEAREVEANQLAAEQDQYRLRRGADESPEQPSYFVDIIVVSIGFVNDGIDALELTGILGILTWLISLLLSAINLLIIFFSNRAVKNPRTNTTVNITQKRLMKLAIGSALEAIPFLSIGPWSIISTAWSVWDKVKAHRDARSQPQTTEVSSNVPEVV